MPKAKELKGPEKAAIFLLSIGEDLASQFIKELSTEEVKKLSECMARLEEIPPETFKEVNEEFKEKFSSHIAGKEFLKRTLSKVLGEEGAEYILGEESEFFNRINEMDPEVLANFIRQESPQTIASVISNLKPEKASLILAYFPNSLKSEIILRMAQLDAISVDAIKTVNEVLKEEIFKKNISEVRKIGGLEITADILNRTDRSTQDFILGEIEKADPELAAQLRRKMFVFEDLINIDDRGMQILLKHVKMDDLVLALKTASEAMKNKIFRNVSERVAEMIKEDLEIMGPVRLKDVEKAQQTIIETAKRLEDEGQLIIVRKGEEESLV